MVLEVAVSDVFVVNNAKNRPFIEQFCHTGVNFTQKNLGTIMGFFIVRDTSSLSENIVNFLVSEIKKYYFSQSQKNPEEKFEATLHRVNRMLEELATIGNVNWLGTIDGAVCAVTETTARFSVTGTAAIFLLRDDHLIDISEGLASADAAHNPLKTFADISTGELLPYDKLIITSSELLDLVSFDELQKNAIRMGQKNFVQYVQTVLSNQCPIAVTLITDLYPPEEKRAPTVAPITELPTNFFGALPEVASTAEEAQDSPTDTLTQDIAPLLTDTETGEDYVDPHTGHIYMQGSDAPLTKPSVIDDLSNTATDLLDATKHLLARRKRWIDKRIARITAPSDDRADTVDAASATEPVPHAHHTTTPESPHIHDDISSPPTRPSGTITIDAQHDHDARGIPSSPLTRAKKIATATLFRMRCIGNRCIYTVRTYTSQREKSDRMLEKDPQRDVAPSEKYLQSKNPSTHPQRHLKDFLPRLSRLTRLWGVLSLRSKIIVLGIVLAIITVPFLFSTIRTKLSHTTPPTEITPPEAEPVVQEPLSPPLTTITSLENGKTILQLKGNLVTVGAHTIIFFDNETAQQTLTLPSDAGSIALATAMDDLNMIFFLTTDNTLYSVSPVDGKFAKQPNIPTWDATRISAIATYMTYLYIATPDGIMRHTRIDGGFDAGKNWLKDPFDMTSVSMAIDEQIYLANGTSAAALLSGRKTSFSLDQRITQPTNIFATPHTTAAWIVDTQATTLYKVNKRTGAIESETSHTDLSTVTAFVVDEKKSTAYLLTENSVKSLPMQ